MSWGGCGQNLIPTWTVPTEFWGSWGVSNHPQYQHQNDHFWLKLNCLTLTFNKWVNLFSLLMGRTCGQNLVPTWTIPTKFWGCWGVSNHPKYRHQNNHFWLILNWLTLTFNRWVFFYLSHGGYLWAKVGTHINHPHWVLGVSGGVKQPPVPIPEWPFLANTQFLDSYI